MDCGQGAPRSHAEARKMVAGAAEMGVGVEEAALVLIVVAAAVVVVVVSVTADFVASGECICFGSYRNLRKAMGKEMH